MFSSSPCLPCKLQLRLLGVEVQYRMSDGASGLLILLVRLYEEVMCALRSKSTHQMVIQGLWAQFLFQWLAFCTILGHLFFLLVFVLAQLLDQSCSRWGRVEGVRLPSAALSIPDSPAALRASAYGCSFRGVMSHTWKAPLFLQTQRER